MKRFSRQTARLAIYTCTTHLSRRGVLGVLLAFGIFHSAAYAQAVYGSIIGTVTDNTGAVVPNATVKITDVAKGTSTTVQTNGSGEYTVQHLIPDVYQVEVTAAGFAPGTVSNVVVYADTAPKADIKLALGGASSTVTVTTAAPLLTTDRAEVSTILNERAVENLPNLNRNFTAFELLTPGTTYIGWGPGEGSGNPQRSQSDRSERPAALRHRLRTRWYRQSGTDQRSGRHQSEPRCRFRDEGDFAELRCRVRQGRRRLGDRPDEIRQQLLPRLRFRVSPFGCPAGPRSFSPMPRAIR